VGILPAHINIGIGNYASDLLAVHGQWSKHE